MQYHKFQNFKKIFKKTKKHKNIQFVTKYKEFKQTKKYIIKSLRKLKKNALENNVLKEKIVVILF